MTKRKLKKNITKRKFSNRKTKKNTRKNSTKKNKYGGNEEKEKSQLELIQEEKGKFRSDLNKYVKYISDAQSRNQIKDGIRSLINFFTNNKMINTLIPVTYTGKYIEKDKQTATEKIVDYVSPVIFILDNLTGIELLWEKEIVRILNAYFIDGGNFNNLSSRFKESPFEHEVNKTRVNNIKLLLDKSNPFHIMEEGLDENTKTKLAELISDEQQIISQKPEETIVEQSITITEKPITNIKLTLPYMLPSDNDVGYDRSSVPEFWKPIFKNGQELLEIREKFMGIYEIDRYTSDIQKRIQICDLLERIFPGYLTKYTLDYRETAKSLINVNILNCFITLFYGMILYRLYETKQDYLFIFKGGRALQLSLVDIIDIGKYFSEDTDILIVPNRFEGGIYDLNKMKNLSEHIAYLIKWMIPKEINVFVSLPTNPKNTNKDITKLLYNDGKLFKALSDIGFGEISEDIRKFFDNLSYSPIYIQEFETNALYITPTIDDMLAEKLFYYAKYLKFKMILTKKEPIMEEEYANLTIEECDRILFKFKRAILKLVEAILKRDYSDVTDLQSRDSSKLILREFIKDFEDYSNDEKEQIVLTIFP
jgi:hypothetical protein